MNDSLEQPIMADRMTYNNMPTFANSRRTSNRKANHFNSSFQTETSYNLTSSSNIASKVELPFIPYKNHPIDATVFHDSRLPSTTIGNSHSQNTRQASKNSLFGTRVWSSSSERTRLFSKNGTLYHGSKSSNGATENETNTQNDLLNLVTNFGSLLYILFHKCGLWIVWFLNNVSVILLDKVRTIPIPEPEQKNQDMDAESTPRPKNTIFNPNGLSKCDTKQQKGKNPLFYKKLQLINNDVNTRIQQEKNIMERETEQKDKFTESDESLEEITFKKLEPVQQYGTHFFNTNNGSKKKLNLESCYLKTAMSLHALQDDKKPQDLILRSSDIKESLMSFYTFSNGNTKPQDKSIIRPSFTRSTTRFKDLEWLLDDKADYLNDLESTRLFKEYQKIIAERKANEKLQHLSSLKERGLGVRPLKEEQAEEINKIWRYQPDGVLSNKYSIKITSADLLTLSNRHWLNDNVIDFYLQLIKDYVNSKGISQIHTFSTFFYTTLKSKGYAGVRKWANRAKVDVSKLDYIFVPCNLNQVHWALAVIDNVNQTFQYVDSLNGDGTDILAMLVEYMTEETSKNHGPSMNGKDYSAYFINGHAECPGQQNGFDCGVFTCTAVDYIARNRDLDYSQADMPNLRRRMAWEILKGKLLDH